jgi:hypothetical protein
MNVGGEMENRINSILQKISILNIELEPTINVDKINNYEKQLNIKFPEDYVLYLTKIQNGGCSDKLDNKGPYYGIYSFEKSIEENKEWEVNINKDFKLFEDIEIDGDEELLEKYQNTGTLNGTIPICEYGCGDFFRLIVNGKKYGEIIVDGGTIDGGGYYFMNVDILTFYENWLDRKIKNNGELVKAYYSFLEFGNNNKYKIV